MKDYKSWNQMEDESEDFKGWIVAAMSILMLIIVMWGSCNKIQFLEKQLKQKCPVEKYT